MYQKKNEKKTKQKKKCTLLVEIFLYETVIQCNWPYTCRIS